MQENISWFILKQNGIIKVNHTFMLKILAKIQGHIVE